MHRRPFLLAMAGLPLAGCAHRPPKPPLKPNDLGRIGMLPIKEWPDSGSIAQFNRAINPDPKIDGTLYPAISPSLLGMAIGQAIKNSRNADRIATGAAVAWVDFAPEPTLRRALDAEFAARASQIKIEMIDRPELSKQIRDDVLKDLPRDVDAILDVQIRSAGYYAMSKNRGYSPYFDISARLVDTVNPGEVVEDFSYEGNFEEAKDDIRHFTMTGDLIQPSLRSFRGNADAIRAGVTAVFQQVAVKLVDDIIRVRDKLPRLD